MRLVARLAGVIAAAMIVGGAGYATGVLAGDAALAPGSQTTGPSPTSLVGVLAIEDARAPLPGDVGALLAAARSGNLAVQRAAVRALGRLERRDAVTDLLPYLSAPDMQVRRRGFEAGRAGGRARGEQTPHQVQPQRRGAGILGKEKTVPEQK